MQTCLLPTIAPSFYFIFVLSPTAGVLTLLSHWEASNVCVCSPRITHICLRTAPFTHCPHGLPFVILSISESSLFCCRHPHIRSESFLLTSTISLVPLEEKNIDWRHQLRFHGNPLVTSTRFASSISSVHPLQSSVTLHSSLQLFNAFLGRTINIACADHLCVGQSPYLYTSLCIAITLFYIPLFFFAQWIHVYPGATLPSTTVYFESSNSFGSPLFHNCSIDVVVQS